MVVKLHPVYIVVVGCGYVCLRTFLGRLFDMPHTEGYDYTAASECSQT
jgi:hypothetical protein